MHAGVRLTLCACVLQALYLLLVTNKASNILEDLETLRLLAKVVPEYVPSLDEDGVSQAAFELLFAFDEAREWSAWLKTDHVRQNASHVQHRRLPCREGRGA